MVPDSGCASRVELRLEMTLCGNNVLLPLRKLVERYIPGLHVLAYTEVSAQAEVQFVSQVEAS